MEYKTKEGKQVTVPHVVYTAKVEELLKKLGPIDTSAKAIQTRLERYARQMNEVDQNNIKELLKAIHYVCGSEVHLNNECYARLRENYTKNTIDILEEMIPSFAQYFTRLGRLIWMGVYREKHQNKIPAEVCKQLQMVEWEEFNEVDKQCDGNILISQFNHIQTFMLTLSNMFKEKNKPRNDQHDVLRSVEV